MKIRFPKIGAVIFMSSMLVSAVSAAPYNQYQDPIKEQRIAAYTWLYGEALGGNEIAKRNLKVLERIYGPALTDLSKLAAREWQMTHLVSAWVLGNSEKAEPLVRGTGTIARTAVGYP